jgi:hypothetical protein
LRPAGCAGCIRASAASALTVSKTDFKGPAVLLAGIVHNLITELPNHGRKSKHKNVTTATHTLFQT